LNVVVGLALLVVFMLSGFLLVFLHDTAAGQAIVERIGEENYHLLVVAHTHGNMFALINVIVGLVVSHFGLQGGTVRWASILALLGFLMPVGIFLKVFVGFPPPLILLGDLSMLSAVALLTWAAWRGGSPD